MWTPPRSTASEIFQDFAPLIAADLGIFEDWGNGGVDADALWNIAFGSANSFRKKGSMVKASPDGSVGTSVQRSSWVIGTHWCSPTDHFKSKGFVPNEEEKSNETNDREMPASESK